MAQTTKLELEQLLKQRNDEIQKLRLRVSTLEGMLALRSEPRADVDVRTAVVNGTKCYVFIERNGAHVRRRYVPMLT